MQKQYTGWLGPMDHEHKNPPPPFNPAADPAAKERYRRVTESRQADGFHKSHNREECRIEWARRYGALKAG